MKSLRIILGMAFVGLFAFTQSAMAFCAPFWPPERVFVPSDDMQVFISYDDGIERMVVQPAFTGNVDDFGMVVATPNRPVLREAPENIFDDLEDHTNPFRFGGGILMAESADDALPSVMEKTVTIIEQKDIGDYTSTVLKATDANDMTDWLEDNGYSYTDENVDTFEYYIDEGGYYFTALKINTSEVGNETFEDEFWGQLEPLEISFVIDDPMIPIRIMRNDMDEVSLTMYTLADNMMYLPGVDTLYAAELNEIVLPTKDIQCFRAPCPQPDEWANEYDARDGKWLVRQNINLNPRDISQDVDLSISTTGYSVDPHKGMKTINSAQFPANTGIIKGTAPTWNAPAATYGNLLNGTRLLRWGSRGGDVAELQILLNRLVGTNLVTDGIWGRKTHTAVSTFQTEYNLKIDGIVGNQTRQFLRLVATDL